MFRIKFDRSKREFFVQERRFLFFWVRFGTLRFRTFHAAEQWLKGPGLDKLLGNSYDAL